jgi:hypothetical protein
VMIIFAAFFVFMTITYYFEPYLIRSDDFAAFFVFMTITYYFEPYMVPVGLLLIFVKHYIATSYIGNKNMLQIFVTAFWIKFSSNRNNAQALTVHYSVSALALNF